MRKINTVVAAFSVLALGVGLTACSSSSGSSSGNDTVRIGGTQGYINFLSAPYGDVNGIFEERGLDAEVIYFDGAGMQLEALMAGEVDLINYNPAGLALSYMNGVTSPKAVGTVTDAAVGYALMVATNGDISSVEDLAGGSIGSTSAGSTTDMYAKYINDENQLNAEVLPLGGSALTASLTGGKVEAILAFPPMSYQLMEEGDGEALVDFGQVTDVGYADIWLASEELANDEEKLRATLNSLYDSVQLMIDDKDSAIEYFVEEMGVSEAVATRAYEEILPHLSTDNTIDPALMQNAMNLADGMAEGEVPDASDVVATIDLGRED